MNNFLPLKIPCRRREWKGPSVDCQISPTASLIYLHSVENCNEIRGCYSGARYRPSFSIAVNPLRFTPYHLSLMLHILECVQLAEHWGGILCKFPNNKPTRPISLCNRRQIHIVCVRACVRAFSTWGITVVKLLKLTAAQKELRCFSVQIFGGKQRRRRRRKAIINLV